MVHLGFLPSHLTLVWPYNKWHGLEIGFWRTSYLWPPQGKEHLHTSPSTSRRFPTFLYWGRQLWLCNWRCPLWTIPGRWQMAPSCFPVKVLVISQTELQDPWQGDIGNYLSYGGVEAFPGGSGASVWNMDGSQKPGVFYESKEVEL